MTPDERRALIERYRSGYQAVVDALAEVDLDAPAPDGGWTPRQVAHHLADSEMTSALRLRRVLAETEPTIEGYDENEYARRFRYAEREVEPALVAFRAARETTAQILDGLSEQDWARTATHTESGAYGAEMWLEIYAQHAHDHAEQIRRCKR
jgi:hypothetical protein